VCERVREIIGVVVIEVIKSIDVDFPGKALSIPYSSNNARWYAC
jgi:hypothetical protein